jgi:hypothetical protein
VETIAGEPGRFDLVVEVLPDAVFALQVTEEVRGRLYAFECVSEPLFGRVVRSHERYDIEDLGEQGCRLTLTNAVHFDGEISVEALAMESMMLNFANSIALAKLKLHAEQGAEAVKEYERAQFGWLDDLDCLD